jgi:hypothetical protein
VSASVGHLRALSTWLLGRGALAVGFGALYAVGFTEAVGQGSGQGSGLLAALALCGVVGGAVQVAGGAQLRRRPELSGLPLVGVTLGLVQVPLGAAVSVWALATQRGQPVQDRARHWVWWGLALSVVPVAAVVLSAVMR